MSATNSAIDMVISALISMSSSYANEAKNLLSDAAGYLTGADEPQLESKPYTFRRKGIGLTSDVSPVQLEQVELPSVPDVAKLQRLLDITDRFTAAVPQLIIPAFNARIPKEPPDFNQPRPRAPTIPGLGSPPSIDPGELPTPAKPEPVKAFPIRRRFPDAPRPVFGLLDADPVELVEKGLEQTKTSLKDWQAYMQSLGAQLAPVQNLLNARLSGVLSRREFAEPNATEDARYAQGRQKIAVERYAATDELSRLPGQPTGLPWGAPYYARLRMVIESALKDGALVAQIAADRMDLESKHLQWAVRVAASTVTSALELLAQCGSWQMRVMEQVFACVELSSTVMDELLRVKEEEFKLFTLYNEFQIRRTKNSLEAEKTQLTCLKIQVANNKLISNHNDQQLQIYDIAEDFIAARVKLWETQADYALKEFDFAKLEFAVFNAEVDVFRSRTRRSRAQINAMQAEIKGDMAKSQAEFAKVELYEAEIKAKTANIQALAARASGQAATARQTLEAYNAMVEAKLKVMASQDKVLMSSVDAAVAEAELESKQKNIKLTQQGFEDMNSIQDAKLNYETNRIKLMKSLDEYAIEVNKLTATSDVAASGSGTVASIAKAALAGFNAIGVRQLQEEA